MNTTFRHSIGILLLYFLSLNGIAQKPAARVQPVQPRQATGQADLENLVARDSYVFYSEFRMVGRLAGTRQVSDVFEALKMLDSLPSEVASVHNFLLEHADELDVSKAVFAFDPARPGVPQALLAIEMESPEAVAKLEPKVATLLISLSNTSTSKTAAAKPAAPSSTKPSTQASTTSIADIERDAAAKGVFIKSSGSLLCIADSRIDFAALRPKNSPPMSSDELFSMGRAHFPSEPFFLYYNQKVGARVEEQRKKESEALVESERKRMEAAAKSQAQTTRPESASPAANPMGRNGSAVVVGVNLPPQGAAPISEPSPVAADGSDSGIQQQPVQPEVALVAVPKQIPSPTPAPNPEQQAASNAMSSAMRSLFKMADVWPDGIAGAIDFDGDDVALHAVLLGNGQLNVPIPFVPFLVSGPPMNTRAAAYMPADTDLFVSGSLDLESMFDRWVKQPTEQNGVRNEKTDDVSTPAQQMAALEVLLGFRIKEDLINSFGNEVAVAVRMHAKPGESDKVRGMPVSATHYTVYIALRNRDAAERMLPKILALSGMNATGSGETVGNSTIQNYGSFAIAFSDNYLILGQNAADVKDSLSSEGGNSLGSQNDFRSATQWQPQMRTAQAYLSDKFFAGDPLMFDFAGDQGKAFVARFKIDPKAVTYSLSGDAQNQQHDLHIPISSVLGFVGQLAIANRYGEIIGSEFGARVALLTMANAEKNYKEGAGHGSYGSLSDLTKSNTFQPGFIQNKNYHFEVTASGDDFQATATPVQYGVGARHSFFTDSTGTLRGGDFGGRRAGPGDPVIQTMSPGAGLPMLMGLGLE